MAFDRATIEPDDWPETERNNDVVEHLRARRSAEVKYPAGAGIGGHMSWMTEGLEQLLLYRIVALADGCAMCWNGRNLLGAILCARAMLETVALLREFIDQLARLCETGDAEAIKLLIAKRTFGAKLASLTGGKDELTAINVLTAIDKLDRGGTRAREIYDQLSEVCHPNFAGHHAAFAEFDKKTGTLHLNEGAGLNKGPFAGILLTFRFVAFVEGWLGELASLVPRLADVAERQRR